MRQGQDILASARGSHTDRRAQGRAWVREDSLVDMQQGLQDRKGDRGRREEPPGSLHAAHGRISSNDF